jgi:hypothetical protein
VQGLTPGSRKSMEKSSKLGSEAEVSGKLSDGKAGSRFGGFVNANASAKLESAAEAAEDDKKVNSE